MRMWALQLIFPTVLFKVFTVSRVLIYLSLIFTQENSWVVNHFVDIFLMKVLRYDLPRNLIKTSIKIIIIIIDLMKEAIWSLFIKSLINWNQSVGCLWHGYYSYDSWLAAKNFDDNICWNHCSSDCNCLNSTYNSPKMSKKISRSRR